LKQCFAYLQQKQTAPHGQRRIRFSMPIKRRYPVERVGSQFLQSSCCQVQVDGLYPVRRQKHVLAPSQTGVVTGSGIRADRHLPGLVSAGGAKGLQIIRKRFREQIHVAAGSAGERCPTFEIGFDEIHLRIGLVGVERIARGGIQRGRESARLSEAQRQHVAAVVGQGLGFQFAQHLVDPVYDDLRLQRPISLRLDQRPHEVDFGR
jgi:hypothetical protein